MKMLCAVPVLWLLSPPKHRELQIEIYSKKSGGSLYFIVGMVDVPKNSKFLLLFREVTTKDGILLIS